MPNTIISGLDTLAGDDDFAKTEIQRFRELFERYKGSNSRYIDWNRLLPLEENDVLPYAKLVNKDRAATKDRLSKLAVIKLNGGLGTSMGCVGPKSGIEVREGVSFMDMSVIQLISINERYGVNIPLVLMNSFNTHADTMDVVKKYGDSLSIITFNQSKFPRIDKQSELPIPKSMDAPNEMWYPPGHGDIYEKLLHTGTLDELISRGKEYVFVGNADNLGATVDEHILNYLASDAECDYVVEVTDKTLADVKGGTIIRTDTGIQLLELAQVPPDHVNEFKSINKFKVFNTNNIWFKTRALKELLLQKKLELDIIVNQKSLEGKPVIQLETAMVAAMQYFKGSRAINVPRTRFLPVKKTADLFLVKSSDLYSVKDGFLTKNPSRIIPDNPLVKFSTAHFKSVADFETRFPSIPNITELIHLTIAGDVTFGKDVVLKGTVIIIAAEGASISIPRGSILDNKIINGNLVIHDH